MTNLSTLTKTIHKKGLRKGRGEGSGLGKNAGRGHKGQVKRGHVRIGFEGNQKPLIKRTPKLKGFSRPQQNTRAYESLTLSRIAQYYKDGETVNMSTLIEKGLVDSKTKKVRIIASGYDKKLKFEESESIYLTKGVKEILK